MSRNPASNVNKKTSVSPIGSGGRATALPSLAARERQLLAKLLKSGYAIQQTPNGRQVKKVA